MTLSEKFIDAINAADNGDTAKLLELDNNTIYLEDGQDSDYYTTIRFMKRCYQNNQLELLKKIIKIDPFLMVSDMVDSSVLTYVFEKFEENVDKAMEILDIIPEKYLRDNIYFHESPYKVLKRKPNRQLTDYLKNKGIVEPDFLERGVHDYRKDACLTMEDFEKIIVRCIVYYNSQRILKNFPYTEDMIKNDIKPYANSIFEYSKLFPGANLIPVTSKQIMLTLLPRTTGVFSRFGLKVNKMRYKNENYVEKYLVGGKVTVAYNPDNVSYIWLIENGHYIQFKLIESRYDGKELTDVELIEKEHRKLVNSHCNSNTQAQIDLANSLEKIIANVQHPQKLNMKYVTSVKNRAKRKYHVDFMEEILNG